MLLAREERAAQRLRAECEEKEQRVRQLRERLAWRGETAPGGAASNAPLVSNQLHFVSDSKY